MGKRFWSLTLSMALIGGVFSAMPARAQEAPPATVPAVVNIEDPMGDANYINDQGVGAPLPGDTVLPASAGTVSDILKAWFTSDATTISAHILTKAAPPASTPLIFHVRVDPGTGTECLWFRASFPSIVQGQEDPVVAKKASLRDTCPTALGVQDGELKVEKTADTNGVITMTFPRSIHPAFAEGSILKAPTADSRNFPGGQLTVPQIDDTKPGTDFTVTSGGSPVVTDPGPPSEPKKPIVGKDCGKKKSRGKGAKKCPKPKPPVASSCPAFVPGEEGAEAETSIVTDAATAEKPVVVDLKSALGGPSLGPVDETSSIFHNIQVDSAAADAGLYVKFEFPEFHDYDLYLDRADGSTAANSGDFNVAPGHDLGSGSPDGAWEAGTDYESVLGIRTADCAGYTARMVSYLTNGGATTLSLWLGDVVADPVAAEGAQAQEAQASQVSAADLFFGAMRMSNPLTADSAQASGTPAANKGCKRGKGKKNGCKKPPVACSPIAPSEQGADKPTVVVTDAATAEAPVEQTITLAQSMSEGIVDEASYDYFNVQVDSAGASAGLYVTFEFPTRRDYDLYARWSDGSEAASSHGFNPAAEASAPEPVPFDPSNTRTNHAGETHADSENLVGLITPDCGGYTMETVNWLGEGGEFVVKLWLGEGATEPRTPGEVPAA